MKEAKVRDENRDVAAFWAARSNLFSLFVVAFEQEAFEAPVVVAAPEVLTLVFFEFF